MDLSEYKISILNAIQSIRVSGVDDLITWLTNETDFFTAPASTKFHGDYEGGLMIHSWMVYTILREKVSHYKLEVPERAVVLSGLMHDVCKVNFYKRGTRNVKDEKTGQWSKEVIWMIDDKLPLGHGEESALLVSRFIRLTDQEMEAIRWHMGGFTDGASDYIQGITLGAAMNKNKLLVLLNTADIESSHLIET